MARPPSVAVITADLIASRLYSPKDRQRIDAGLRAAIEVASKQYRRDIHTPASFRVTGGDEFQWVIKTSRRAFEILLFLRALVTGIKVEPMLMFRASIGIGQITVDGRRSSYEKDGPAFVRSRAGLDFLSAHRLRITSLGTGHDFVDRTGNVVLTLLDSFQQRWTRSQWEAIRWALVGMKRTEISEHLDVAHQNVSKRLIAAEWDTFKVGSEFMGELIEPVHPDRDAEGGRTQKRAH